VERPRAALREIRTEPIAGHIALDFVLVRQRRNGTGGIFSVKGFVEEEEITKATADDKI
jgi:hypothetical protein